MKTKDLSDDVAADVLRVLREAAVPLSIDAVAEKAQLTGPVCEDVLERLTRNGYDVKWISTGESALVSLVRTGPDSNDVYYRILGDVKTPFILASDWHIGCLPAGELVGPGVPVEKVAVGDDLLGDRVTRVFARDPEPDEVVVTLRGVGLAPKKFSGNHPILVVRTQGKNSSRVYIRPEGKTAEFVRADSVSVGDWLCFKKFPEKQSIINLRALKTHRSEEEYVIDSEMARFLGLFLGDGYVANNQDATIGFCFNAAKDHALVEFCTRFVQERFNRKCCTAIKGGSIQVMFCHRALAEWLCQMGRRSWEKRIPECLFSAPVDIVKSFLRGYGESDGWFFPLKSQFRFTTTSPILAYQIPLLSTKLNTVASVTPLKKWWLYRLWHTGSWHWERPSYSITLLLTPKKPRYVVDEQYVYCRVGDISTEPLLEPVYNIETDTHQFSCPFITHNSKGFSPLAFKALLSCIDKYKVKSILIPGDLFQGKGVYRVEAADLLYPDLDAQLRLGTEYLKQIPKSVHLHMIIGNHENYLKSCYEVGYDIVAAVSGKLPNSTYYGHAAKLSIDKKYTILMIHGAGAPSYAVSYKAQKVWDTLLEKPTILAFGHLHQLDVLPRPTGRYVIQCGTMQRESSYLVNKGITPELGWIVCRSLSDTEGDFVTVRPKLY